MPQCDWSSLKDNNNDTYAQNVTDRILHLVNKYIPNKHVHTRKSDPLWLNNIKRLMRKRKRLYDKYKRSKNQPDFNTYKQVRNEVTFQICKAKNEETDKLTNILKEPNICQKDWWKRLCFTQQTILDEYNASLPQTMNAPQNNLESFRITSDEVESTLLSLPTGKASGSDSINYKILKDLAQPLSTPLKDLFNFALEKGQVPIIWK